MKTILVPTDYSDVANNALHYAIELAKFSKGKIILLHSYQVPLPTGDVPVLLVSPAELEKENIHRIKNLEKKISKELPRTVKVEHVVRAGFAVDEIVSTAKEKQADVIVMGVTGQGKLGESLMGSNVTAVMKRTPTPVLVIPAKAKFKKPAKIVLAVDYKGELKEKQIKIIKDLGALFDAKILVLDVVKPALVPTNEDAIAAMTLESTLAGVAHTLYFPEADDIPSEINSFVDNYKADWLIMIPHKHKLLEGLFHKSNTRQMAFHSHVPLLSIHE